MNYTIYMQIYEMRKSVLMKMYEHNKHRKILVDGTSHYYKMPLCHIARAPKTKLTGPQNFYSEF